MHVMLKQVCLVFILFGFALQAQCQLYRSTINFGISGINSYRILTNSVNSTSIDSLISEKNKYEKPIYSYGAWIEMASEFNKRFFMIGGLRYTRLGFTYKFDNNIPAYLTDSGYTNYNPHVLSASFTDIFHDASFYIKAAYSFLKKPNYSVYCNGSFLINIGLQKKIITNSEIQVMDNRNNVTTLKHTFKNKFFSSANSIITEFSVALGAQIKLSKRSALMAESAFYMSYNPYEVIIPIDIQFYYLSLNIGLAYSIN
jgi:hypothetical protein